MSDEQIIDYAEYREQIRQRLVSIRDRLDFDVSELSHRPRDPFKRQWLAQRGLLTTPIEVEPPPATTRRPKGRAGLAGDR
jgi:hypothetical protein